MAKYLSKEMYSTETSRAMRKEDTSNRTSQTSRCTRVFINCWLGQQTLNSGGLDREVICAIMIPLYVTCTFLCRGLDIIEG